MGCRGTAAKDELIRIVVRDGSFIIDSAHRLPGRGAYLHPDADCAACALRSRGVQRTLKVAPTVSDQLAGLLAGLPQAS